MTTIPTEILESENQNLYCSNESGVVLWEPSQSAKLSNKFSRQVIKPMHYLLYQQNSATEQTRGGGLSRLYPEPYTASSPGK